MVAPAPGQVVVVRFPFSDLSNSKLRPAVVLADAEHGEWILCQVTSRPYGDARALELDDTSFVSGGLRRTSYARPAKLFTANRDLMVFQAGDLNRATLRKVVDSVVAILRSAVVPEA